MTDTAAAAATGYIILYFGCDSATVTQSICEERDDGNVIWMYVVYSFTTLFTSVCPVTVTGLKGTNDGCENLAKGKCPQRHTRHDNTD